MKKQLLVTLLATIAIVASAEIPAGYYYSADGLKKEALKTALNNIASNGKFLTYGGEGVGYTWEGFYYTDRNEADSSVIDMYSNQKFKFTYTNGEPDFKAVEGMHIEHSLPKSWWGSVMYNSYKDLNHLFPAEGSINSAKNDLPLGIVGEATSDNGVSKVGKNTFRTADYSGNCFEPADEYKGDFARAYFYIATIYEEFGEMGIWNSPMIDNNTYPVWKDWALDLLLQWHRQDPVSEKELKRQELVYQVQGNRNPFIDYPELVEYIWGDKQDEAFEVPSDARAFLISPTRWDYFNFGVVMQGNNQRNTFVVDGRNINTAVLLKIKGATPAFKLSTTKVTASEALQGDFTVSLDFDASEVGEYVDTLEIYSGGITTPIDIPIKASVTNVFMALAATDISTTEATLNWMGKVDAQSYKIDVYQGGNQASDLFFSYYLEGSSFNKALAIYNGTGADVDLSKYELRKQNNGVGSFKSDTLLQLSGTLKDGETYVLAHKGADASIRALANRVCGTDSKDEKTLLSFNGNDALALYHCGIQIDILGETNNAKDWGKDVTLQRKANVEGPVLTFDWDEWEAFATDYYTDINKHASNCSDINYIIKQENIGNHTSCHIKNLTPGQSYSYRITAVANEETRTVNASRFVTDTLATPLALEASDIEGTAFEPLWETAPDVQKYLIDIYQLTGTGFTTDKQGFDSIVTNKALLEAEGWRFTTTSTSSTASACGESVPCIAFKNEKTNKLDTLVSKLYPDTALSLSFMYRWGNKRAKDSIRTAKLVLDGFNGHEWINIDTLVADSTTEKKYPVYQFAHADGYTQFRWIYFLKVYGSVTFDDVTVYEGSQDTTFIKRNEPWYEGWWVTNLDTAATYYYRLRATSHDYVSGYSNEIKVTTTNDSTATEHNNIEPEPIDDKPVIDAVTYLVDNSLIVWSNREGIGMQGATAGDQIRIYTMSGQIVYNARIDSDNLFIPFSQHGIYLIQIFNGQRNQLYKVAK